MKKKNTALRNLKFLQRRHGLAGMDMDYLGKLSNEELEWLEGFSRNFYGGGKAQSPEHKRESTHREYMAKRADAQCIAEPLSDAESQHDDLDPETLLILRESLEQKKK